MKKKGTGHNIKQPEKKCSDKNCPFHGTLSIRGRFLSGKVTSDKMSKSAIVSWDRKVFVPKFERYEKRKSKVNAHNPDCIDAKKGDLVLISECRPLSKTKHFVVVEILGKESAKDIIKAEAVAEDEGKEKAQSASFQASETDASVKKHKVLAKGD
ncbi:30S ribosomal protein S17 [Candidatus Woesearchaeota archaeon]|nr:30S ribosomal protein S17 [Candidatus Woesearchaeota archaeon]